MAHDHGVKFIRLWFTDILGFLKSFAITINQLEDALAEGVGFDGASIEGFARIDESDMVAMPDPNTFALLPWRPQKQDAVARLFCDIHQPDGTPYEGDPRWVLKRALSRARKLGYTFYVGPELEFFYFKGPKPPLETLDEGGYFDLTPQDAGNDIRRDTILTLEAMGIEVEFSHHEAAHSQHEIDLRYTDALTMADSTVTYRLVVKEIAQKFGAYATFMPKPLFGSNGSGMHVHQSLFKGERNAFFDAEDANHLSRTCRSYVAGLLAHAPEITLVTNQWVNSYKRLVPGYEAPNYVSWALKNRSDLLRVPAYKPGREEAVRVEFRSPDPACNPYLAFAAMLSAGLDGIEKGLTPPPPSERDVYKLTRQEREAAGIAALPSDLYEAIKLASGSDLLKGVLGETVFTKLIENKLMEWEKFRAQVTSYEIDEYLPLL
ncbi:MAG TPA: glutamine synthetase family protein [Armatimonadota bacterium]